MASLNFPSSPVDGQKYTLNGITYTYNATVSAWLTTLLQAVTISNTSSSYDTQVIFNNSGTATGATGLVFNYTANTLVGYNATFNNNLTVANNLTVTGNVNGTSANISGPTLLIAGQNVVANINGLTTNVSSAFTKANGAVRTGYSTISNGTTSLTTTSNAGTLIISAGNVINVIANTTNNTLIISQIPTGVTAQAYTGGISAVTVDAYGRITSLTGSAGYITSASQTITDDNSSVSTFYPLLTTATSGSIAAANVSSSGLSYVPSTGTLSATVMTSTSDVTLKENIKPIQDALNIVSNLTGVGFTWKENSVPSYGVIAQDIEKVIPELVHDINDIKRVNYEGIIPFLIESIKELKQEIEILKGSDR